MATKPIKFLELHYTMTQFLIIVNIIKRFDGSIYRNLSLLSLFILCVNEQDFESAWLWNVNCGKPAVLRLHLISFGRDRYT